jgi:elongation factor 1-alpha
LLYECGKRPATALNFVPFLDEYNARHGVDLTFGVFKTRPNGNQYKFTIIDTPGCVGRRDYTKHVIAGAAVADVALLVVDSSGSPADVRARLAIGGHTRELARLVCCAGVKKIIVVCAKMDLNTEQVDNGTSFSKDRYDAIKLDLDEGFFESIGYRKTTVEYVPSSGLLGDNIKSASPNLHWYPGRTLVEALNECIEPIRMTETPLRVLVFKTVCQENADDAIIGYVQSGAMEPGIDVSFAPSNVATWVTSIGRNGTHGVAKAGDFVYFRVEDDIGTRVPRGSVASITDIHPAVRVASFDARVKVEGRGRITVDFTATVHCHAAKVMCKVTRIKRKMDQRTGRVLEENPECVVSGEDCVVSLEPAEPLSVEPFEDFPILGRMIVRDEDHTVGVGVVMSITPFDDGNGDN